MAVINCPSCKKKISDKAKTCSHCDIELGSIDEDKLAAIRQTNLIQKSQKLMNHSFITQTIRRLNRKILEKNKISTHC